MATERAVADPSEMTLAQALDEVIKTIQGGSALQIGADATLKLRNRYAPDFQDRLDNGVPFESARQKLLPLARMVGNLATTLAVFSAVAQKQTKLPSTVDADSALLAAEVVAHMNFCPPPQPNNPAHGNFCKPQVSEPATALAQEVQGFLSGVSALRA